jgi:UDP-N-acetyl-D-mannosaminuronate dehydrogenase
MRIGILGYGEVGKAIQKLYTSTSNLWRISLSRPLFTFHIKDLDFDEGIRDCDYLHVCIPYSDDFVDQVCECIEQENPKNVIIHSTVQVGTTRNIMKKSGLINICHAPVRGVHPDLYEGLRTFPMYLGYDKTQHASDLVDKYTLGDTSWFIYNTKILFGGLNVKTKIVDKFETSELAKLASTSYYGMCIAFHAEMNSLCDEMGLSFEEVMTEWNKQYNNGYKRLEMNNVVRPVLNPPEGSIGGHCIIPNAKLLKDFYYRTSQTKELPDFILKYK